MMLPPPPGPGNDVGPLHIWSAGQKDTASAAGMSEAAVSMACNEDEIRGDQHKQ